MPLLVGAIISAYQVDQRINAQLPSSLENQHLIVTGTVVSKPNSKNGLTKFDFDVEGYQIAKGSDGWDINYAQWHGGKVLLSVRYNENSPFIVERGQHLTLPVKLKRPRGLVNPVGFDYHAWLLSKNYVARGYIRTTIWNQLTLNEHKNPKRLSIQSTLNALDGYLEKSLFENPLYFGQELKQRGILRALLLGDRHLISSEQWDVFLHTGTIHLMAISGLHVGLLAGFSFFLTRRLISVVADSLDVGLLRFTPAAISLIISGSYAFVSGLGVPSQRAWLALLIFYTINIFGRITNPFRIVLSLALLIVFVNPFALTQNGFLLSFGAVIVLLACFGFGSRADKSVVSAVFTFLKTQWVMLVGLLLLLMFCALPVNPMAFFANLIAVPVVSIIVLPCLFLSAAVSVLSQSIAVVLLQLADTSLDILMWVLEVISLAGSSVYLSLNSWWLVSAIFLFVCCSLVPRQFAFHTFAVICFVAVALSDKTQKVDKISVLDVGQGLAIIVESEDETLVYDTGAKFSESFDIGADVVAPYLRHKNIQLINAVVLSHNDFDHAGGLKGLAHELPISRLYANEVSSLENTSAIESCVEGKAFVHGNFKVSVLWPNLSSTKNNGDLLKSNNRSCVLLLERAQFNVLFAGDIESDVEYELLRRKVLPRDVDVLIASHHGSNTSSTTAFIKQLNPSHVVFSAGYQNRYQHPSSKVITRFQDFSEAKLWNTANDGAIHFSFEEKGTHFSNSYWVESERQKTGKPWER